MTECFLNKQCVSECIITVNNIALQHVNKGGTGVLFYFRHCVILRKRGSVSRTVCTVCPQVIKLILCLSVQEVRAKQSEEDGDEESLVAEKLCF